MCKQHAIYVSGANSAIKCNDGGTWYNPRLKCKLQPEQCGLNVDVKQSSVYLSLSCTMYLCKQHFRAPPVQCGLNVDVKQSSVSSARQLSLRPSRYISVQPGLLLHYIMEVPKCNAMLLPLHLRSTRISFTLYQTISREGYRSQADSYTHTHTHIYTLYHTRSLRG